MHFRSIEDCRDIEEINAWKQYVEEMRVVSPETMLSCFDAIARDNARTPMQWNSSRNAGFSEGTPWIAVNSNYREINTEAALADPDSVFYFYQKLIRLRHENPIIVYGTFRPLLMDDKNVYAYEREYEGQILTVACNWTEYEQKCSLFEEEGTELISNYKEHEAGVLQPYETRVVLR